MYSRLFNTNWTEIWFSNFKWTARHSQIQNGQINMNNVSYQKNYEWWKISQLQTQVRKIPVKAILVKFTCKFYIFKSITKKWKFHGHWTVEISVWMILRKLKIPGHFHSWFDWIVVSLLKLNAKVLFKREILRFQFNCNTRVWDIKMTC